MQAYGGQQGLQVREDCEAEDDLDEITDSQVASETHEVLVPEFLFFHNQNENLFFFFFFFKVLVKSLCVSELCAL